MAVKKRFERATQAIGLPVVSDLMNLRDSWSGGVDQPLNLNCLSDDIGVCARILKERLDILEAGIGVFGLPPKTSSGKLLDLPRMAPTGLEIERLCSKDAEKGALQRIAGAHQ